MEKKAVTKGELEDLQCSTRRLEQYSTVGSNIRGKSPRQHEPGLINYSNKET